MLKEQNLDMAEEINSIASNEMIMNGEGNKTKCSKRQSQKHVMNWGGNYEGLQLNYFAKFHALMICCSMRDSIPCYICVFDELIGHGFKSFLFFLIIDFLQLS